MLVRKGRRKAGLDWMDGVRMCAVKCHNIWCQPDVFDLTVLGKRMSNDRDLMCACGAKYMGGEEGEWDRGTNTNASKGPSGGEEGWTGPKI